MAYTNNTFHIGLVQAGAISAGAYTAGVVDFSSKRSKPGRRRRKTEDELKLRTSAGSDPRCKTRGHQRCLGRSDDRCHRRRRSAQRNRAGALGPRRFDSRAKPPLRRLGPQGQHRPDARCRRSRRRPAGPLVARLAVAWTDRPAGAEDSSRAARADPTANPLHVLLTVANLRGVSYGFALYRNGDYVMRNHMDQMHFRIGRDGEPTCPTPSGSSSSMAG